MENHHTLLVAGFPLNDLVPAPANVAVLRGLLGPLGSAGVATQTTSCPRSRGTAFLRVVRDTPPPPLQSSLCSRDSPFRPEHRQVSDAEFRTLPSPCLYSLHGIETRSFLLPPFLVQCLWLFPHFHFLPSCFWRGEGRARGLLSPYSAPVSVLSLQAKTAPCPLWLLCPLVHLSASRTCSVLWFRLCMLLG